MLNQTVVALQSRFSPYLPERLKVNQDDYFAVKIVKIAAQILYCLVPYFCKSLSSWFFSVPKSNSPDSITSPPSSPVVTPSVPSSILQEQSVELQQLIENLNRKFVQNPIPVSEWQNSFSESSDKLKKQITADIFDRTYPLFLNNHLVWRIDQIPFFSLPNIFGYVCSFFIPAEKSFPFYLLHQGGLSFLVESIQKALKSDNNDGDFAITIPQEAPPNMGRFPKLKDPKLESLALFFLRLDQTNLLSYLKIITNKLTDQALIPFFNSPAGLILFKQALKSLKEPTCTVCKDCYQGTPEFCSSPLKDLASLSEKDCIELMQLLRIHGAFLPKETPNSTLGAVFSHFAKDNPAYPYFPTKRISIDWTEEKKTAELLGYLQIRDSKHESNPPYLIGFKVDIDFITETTSTHFFSLDKQTA